MGKKEKVEKTPERIQMEKDTPYPYYVFFILGNEFCERYAYYGMRSILVIYLKNFLGFGNDLATTIYHTFAALCYFFPLIGGIIADSFWGKFKTIFILSIVYLIGMAIMAISAIPMLGGNEDSAEPGLTNEILTYVALLTVAIGTGGIKPCVSSLGGDQFKDNEVGREQVSGFFALFYASINAGSLLSTFISPLLREKVECFGREDCFFIAFLIPSILMGVAIIAFLAGKSYYVLHKPTGNIFLEFCSATWAGIKGNFSYKGPKEGQADHFMDYALEKGHSAKIVRDAKFVFPIMVMFLPLPFFWALFDMQGSRWTITATQMNGWQGGDAVKMLPDMVQILNPIMILAFLPLFSKVIYPLIEKCGIKCTPLRRMSAGQIVTALAFVISGFVQMAIEKELTPIPNYGSENTLQVLNGIPQYDLTVKSDYWIDTCKVDEGVDCQTTFELTKCDAGANGCDDKMWRTGQVLNAADNEGNPTSEGTFSWIRENIPQDMELLISGTEGDAAWGDKIKLDEDLIHHEEITSIVYYRNDTNGEIQHMKYASQQEKSSSLRVSSIIVNPTKYLIYPNLIRFDYKTGEEVEEEVSGNNRGKLKMYTDKYDVSLSNAEMEQGVYKIRMNLYTGLHEDVEGSGESSGESFGAAAHEKELTDELPVIFGAAETLEEQLSRKTLTEEEELEGMEVLGDFVRTCETEFLWNELSQPDMTKVGPDDFIFKPGSIWTFMVRAWEVDGKVECEIVYGEDSNPNTVNIFLLVPQYVVVTMAEVLNSATGLEFAYTQAPPSMKSVVQSFWLLTTCLGNIIDIFLVEIKLYPTQTGEYFILAMIMFGASMIFVLLSMFYYEYIPEDSFVDDDKNDENEEKTSRKSQIAPADPRDSIEMEKANEAGLTNTSYDEQEADL